MIGTEILARAYGATAVSPPAVVAWGIPERRASSSDSCEGMNEGDAGRASLALYDYQREASEASFGLAWRWYRLVQCCCKCAASSYLCTLPAMT